MTIINKETMTGSIGQEPQVGSLLQTEASQIKPPVVETQETLKSDTGLIGQWERAEDAFWEAKNRVNVKAREIFNDRVTISGRLKELGLLSHPAKERLETEVSEGMLIGKDGRELEVSAGDFGVFFGDLADPARRDVQVTRGTIDLISKSEDMYIDQIGRDPWRPGVVARTGDGQRYRKDIREDEKYAGLRGDLDRDVLDAAREGFDFILDPGTTLKPAGTPTPPRSTVNTTLTS